MGNEVGQSGVITKIERQKGRNKRYNIYINDHYALSVHEDVLIKHQLHKGQVLSEQEWQQLSEDDVKQRAYLQAIRYLNYRARTSKQLEQKLLDQHYEPHIVEAVIALLKDQKYVDDDQYAHLLAEQRLKSQHRGKRWVRQELAAKGLSNDQIEQAVAHVDEDMERALAYDIALKRWQRMNDVELHVKKRRINDFLLRRGYSYSIVNDVLRKLAGPSDYD